MFKCNARRILNWLPLMFKRLIACVTIQFHLCMMHVCLDHIIIHFNVNQNCIHLATIESERARDSCVGRAGLDQTQLNHLNVGGDGGSITKTFHMPFIICESFFLSTSRLVCLFVFLRRFSNRVHGKMKLPLKSHMWKDV